MARDAAHSGRLFDWLIMTMADAPAVDFVTRRVRRQSRRIVIAAQKDGLDMLCPNPGRKLTQKCGIMSQHSGRFQNVTRHDQCPAATSAEQISQALPERFAGIDGKKVAAARTGMFVTQMKVRHDRDPFIEMKQGTFRQKSPGPVALIDGRIESVHAWFACVEV